jgi:hypothetical protein
MFASLYGTAVNGKTQEYLNVYVWNPCAPRKPQRADPRGREGDLSKTLVKTDLIAGLDDQTFSVRYFEIQTPRGSRR